MAPAIQFAGVPALPLAQSVSFVRGSSTIDASMLWPLMGSAVGFSLLFGAIVLMRMRAILARQKIEARLRRMSA